MTQPESPPLSDPQAPRRLWFSPGGEAAPLLVEAVVFDLDGLLLDSERVYEEAARDALGAMGFSMLPAHYAAMIGLPGAECDAFLRATFGSGFSSDLFKELFWGSVEPRFHAGIPLKTGAAELLDELDRLGIAKAVATASERRSLEMKLRGAGVHDRFALVVARDDVKRGKPNPDVYLRAAEGLGVTPSLCLALEDSHNGVRAAHAAGMVTVMVPDLIGPTEEIAALCAAIVDDLHEARRMLGC